VFYFVFFCLFSSFLLANPSGHKVIEGDVKVYTSQNRLKVHASDGSVIHWKDFSIDSNETTQFVQPTSTSVAVNRVVGGEVSKICGKLLSNGKIYLINPQGILIIETGIIDTNGFIGSTLDLVNKDFSENSKIFFNAKAKEAIVNLGTIKAADGSIYLLSYEISNKGMLTAKNGTVGLAAANEVYLQPAEKNKIFIKVDTKSMGTLSSSGTIDAFKVELHGLTNPFTTAINIPGKITTSSLENNNGEIFIRAHGGKLSIDGELTNTGGTTSIEGEDVKIGKDAKILDRKDGKISFDLEGLDFQHAGLLQTYGGQIRVNANKAHFTHSGTIDCSADNGGVISIHASSMSNSGLTIADGLSSKGGQISFNIHSTSTEIGMAKTSAKGKSKGGRIDIEMGKHGGILSSATLDVTGREGGEICIISNRTSLPAAKLLASGTKKGGKIQISQNESQFDLQESSNKKKGLLETNDYTKMEVAGSEAGAINLFTSPTTRSFSFSLGASADLKDQYDLVDGTTGGFRFGEHVEILDNGNVVVTKPYAEVIGPTGALKADAGAFMLFNGTSGQLMSYVKGEIANSLVGYNGIVKLEGNNNYVVLSPDWMGPSTTNSVGAATWSSGNTAAMGFVTTLNSLYGTSGNDKVGARGAVALTNWNYVVLSPYWSGVIGYGGRAIPL